MSLVSFGSDNHAGVHPLLFEEMAKVNQGYAPSYEQDEWSQKVKTKLKEQLGAIDSALVFNGTAANVLCLQLALKSYEAVLCSDVSHLWVDECGAPEKIAGVKLITLPSQDGKILLDSIEPAIVRKGDQHHSQIKMISITQPTEYGTLYSKEEMKAIKDLCTKHSLYLHIDGARLANAAATLQTDLLSTVEAADLISFGGAKNGLMLGEWVVVRNPRLVEGLKFYRKQSLQLPSKTRFLTAPFLKYLENELWRDIANHENKMALLLEAELGKISAVAITRPVQANAVFCQLPKQIIKALKRKFFFYVWDENTFEVRLMTSFSTTPEEIEAFAKEIQNLLQKEVTL